MCADEIYLCYRADGKYHHTIDNMTVQNVHTTTHAQRPNLANAIVIVLQMELLRTTHYIMTTFVGSN